MSYVLSEKNLAEVVATLSDGDATEKGRNAAKWIVTPRENAKGSEHFQMGSTVRLKLQISKFPAYSALACLEL
jgi:hypothetical protein